MIQFKTRMPQQYVTLTPLFAGEARLPEARQESGKLKRNKKNIRSIFYQTLHSITLHFKVTVYKSKVYDRRISKK